MSTGLDWAINRFPQHERLIRRLADDENFEELCEHYAWMSEAAMREQPPGKAEEYESLRVKLETELKEYLYRERDK